MTDVKMPQLGESIAEGTIALWLVDVGGFVEADQPLVQVTTDKADVDLPSPVGGVLKEILAEAGTTVKVGAVIARMDEAAAKGAHPPLAPPIEGGDTLLPSPPAGEGRVGAKLSEHPLAAEGVPASLAMRAVGPAEEVKPPAEIAREAAPEKPGEGPAVDMAGFYSPAVMRLALDTGIDLRTVKGTGAGGRVTKADVLNAAGKEGPGKPVHPPLTPPVEGGEKTTTPRPPGEGQGVRAPLPGEGNARTLPAPPAGEGRPGAGEAAAGSYHPPVYEVEPGDTAVPFSRLRRLIADHMVYSKRTSPHVTTFAEVDLDKVSAIREKGKARIKAEYGISLTYLPFIMAATVMALKDFTMMNSVVQDDTILTKGRINLGVAVDSERGLMVPVVRDAGEMSVIELAKAVGEFVLKVKDRKITPDELAGGTFTVTNPGRHGNLFGTPIISQPQVGILRMGEVVKRAVVVEAGGEDAIAIRPMMYLSLSYDHRVVDGLTANEFLHRVKEYLEGGEFPV